MGVACLLPVNTWTKWLNPGNSGGTATVDRPGDPHLTSPWSGGGIAVLFRRHEPYTDLRNLALD